MLRLACLLACATLLAAPFVTRPGLAASKRTGLSASTRPDRTLYLDATESLERLQRSTSLKSQRGEWERVVLRYRRVVARYPQSAYCDNALLAVGDLYRQMATRFKSPRYNDDAVQAYQALVAEYPSSSLGEKALYAVFQIARDGRDRKRLADAAKAYLKTFPDAARAAEIEAAVKTRAPENAAALPAPPPRGLAQVFNLRFWSGESSTRVVIDVEKQVPLRQDRIGDPDRLWVDLAGTRLHPNLTDRNFPVGDGLLEKVRVAQNKPDVVRIVLDFKDVKAHNIFYLSDPVRLVIDVQGTPRPGPMIAGAAPPSATQKPLPPPVEVADKTEDLDEGPPEMEPEAGSEFDLPPLVPKPGATPEPKPTPESKVADAVRPTPAPEVTPPPPPPIKEARGPDVIPPAAAVAKPADTPAPSAPRANRAGSYSLARQLGLGARKIVIDPGHGGHDPGSIGRGGLQEKDLVLDVALRLEKLVRAELGADVLMTRSTDVFIPLEERTAIANSREADLFLSIHANSSRNPKARGIETYFLNFAVDPHAEEVAARENAISAATLKDLQGLVKAIALNSKIDESRDFAASIHEAMLGGPARAGGPNRGVRTAPFYVLIGANMPSVLAEIAFVSNPDDEKLLKMPEQRERIARGLLEGVRAYLDSLNRTHTQQLTRTGQASKVNVEAKRRP